MPSLPVRQREILQISTVQPRHLLLNLAWPDLLVREQTWMLFTVKLSHIGSLELNHNLGRVDPGEERRKTSWYLLFGGKYVCVHAVTASAWSEEFILF